jgi:uracil-DNA glycosylase
MQNIVIESEWKKELSEYFSTPAWGSLMDFVQKEYQAKEIFPKYENLFHAFSLTPFSKIKVVILGQDPYHGPGQAHGLCFSVQDGILLPPSLKNICKEIEADTGTKKDFTNGNLEHWAIQGVFLLNTILSVESGKPASHRNIGWEDFTDYVIQKISDEHKHIVFLLWGNYARSKKKFIDETKHLILESPHPSPFSAHAGFLGCKHFSQCNTYLKKNGKEEIVW